MDCSAAITFKFQRSLPYAILPVSSYLSSIHQQRLQDENPELPVIDEFCLKCGLFLSDGRSSSRTSRKRVGGKILRAWTVQCTCCGHIDEKEIETGNAALFPSTNSRRRRNKTLPIQQQLPKAKEDANPQGSSKTPAPEVKKPSLLPASFSNGGKPLNKKRKSVLQDMLERNRKREEKRPPQSAGGLVDFLSGL